MAFILNGYEYIIITKTEVKPSQNQSKTDLGTLFN